MLYTILITLLVIDCLILVAAVLLQAGKGGGLAASFGGVSSSADSIIGTRQAGNLLTKVSWWCGGLFLGIAFLLSITTSRRSAPRSILDQTFGAPPAPVTTPAQPNINVLPIAPGPATGTAPTPSATGGGAAKTPTPPPSKTP